MFMNSNKSHRVSLRKCVSYKADAIRPVIELSLSDIGFDLTSIRGKRVLLKPNMLGAYPPEALVTTHPAFVEACITVFKNVGAHVMVGDSSNGVYPIDEVWNVTGIRKAAELAGAEIVPFERSGSVEKNGIRLSKASMDCDLMVNLPKFKTHGLTFLTVTVKNLYGCVPGMVKTAYHREFVDRKDFAKLLVKIAEIIKPQLNIIDAITGMHGNGPSGGKPIDAGLIIAGKDTHSVDAICCNLVGINPDEIDTLCYAKELGRFDPKAPIDIMGEPIEDARLRDFEMPSTFVGKKLDWSVSRMVLSFIWQHMNVQPRIEPSRCQRCGLCLKSCPVGAIGWRGKQKGEAPKIDKKICTQCFCCHEVCPYQAIDLDRSALAKFGQWMGRRRKK
jgi:uncharacterized protein (DUF362 family)/Pyruvate/2-oxoacid:ferredoxin oxidoreductase delta subunit